MRRSTLTRLALAATAAAAAGPAVAPARAEVQQVLTCEGPSVATPAVTEQTSCTHDVVAGKRRFKVLWTPGAGTFTLAVHRHDGHLLAKHDCEYSGMEATCTSSSVVEGTTSMYSSADAFVVRGQFHTSAALSEPGYVVFESGTDVAEPDETDGTDETGDDEANDDVTVGAVRLEIS